MYPRLGFERRKRPGARFFHMKALIASELAFKLNPKEVPAGRAAMTNGLFQLIDQAIKVVANVKGELTDHLVMIDTNDILDPNIIICAGIR